MNFRASEGIEDLLKEFNESAPDQEDRLSLNRILDDLDEAAGMARAKNDAATMAKVARMRARLAGLLDSEGYE